MEFGLGVDCLSYLVLWIMSPALQKNQNNDNNGSNK